VQRDNASEPPNQAGASERRAAKNAGGGTVADTLASVLAAFDARPRGPVRGTCLRRRNPHRL
jgi:hypothetical protein